MDEFTRYLPHLFVIGLFASFMWRSRRRTPLPVQVRRATIAQKHHDIMLRSTRWGSSAVSYYKVTFEIMDTREQLTFSLKLDQFAFLEQGMSGNLTSQGTKYLGFEADTPLEEPRADERTTDIKVRCEECGQSSRFPPGERGTVQQCTHCRAYVDVEG